MPTNQLNPLSQFLDPPLGWYSLRLRLHSYSNCYLECHCSVEQVWEVKVHDVVSRDDVRIHLLDKVTPRLVCVVCECEGCEGCEDVRCVRCVRDVRLRWGVIIRFGSKHENLTKIISDHNIRCVTRSYMTMQDNESHKILSNLGLVL